MGAAQIPPVRDAREHNRKVTSMSSKHSWSSSTYAAARDANKLRGVDDFTYDSSRVSDPVTGRRLVHATLDPRGVTRECLDSDVCPQATAVACFFDVTGSMNTVPRRLLAKLPALHSVIRLGGYLEFPQIMFGAIGDATCDHVPLQVGQFEFGNEADENLANFVLEGGGGGQKTESYELALYFLAHMTRTDCWDKRRKRGYAFMIGDEMAYRAVKPRETADVLGRTIGERIPVEAILAEVLRRWDLYYILPAGSSYVGDSEVLGFWRNLLGQNVIELGDLDKVCEVIALTVGLGEDATDLDTGLATLAAAGTADESGVVGKALAVVGAGRGKTVAVSPPGVLDAPSGNTRL